MPFDHCFSREELSHFLTGTCKPAAVANMAQHVETCSHCQKKLEILAADVQFESQLAQLAATGVSEPLPPHHRIVQWKALGNVGHVHSKVSGKVNLGFLRPAKDPDALGMFGNYLVLDLIG